MTTYGLVGTLRAMISFDPSEITNWSDNPDAPHRLPELIRRLILATVPMPSSIDMPGGSSVNMSGWDGLLVSDYGNVWVPCGSSAWEFSCEKDSSRKATADYKKRTADPRGVDVSKTTFVFVTPRRWAGKGKWAKDSREEGQWADVRALDADDLVPWLEQATAVGHWFARLISKLPGTGVVPLDEWWENWSTVAFPHLSPELVTAGRQDQARRIAEWLQGGPSHYYVQGNTREEAIAFLAACAYAATAPWGAALLARAVVVQTADAWQSLESRASPLVLVRGFSGGNVSSQIAVSRGHHVLTPLDESDDPRGHGCKLPLLGRDEIVPALTEMGLSEAKAHSIARSTARRLPVLRRRLIDEAGGPMPEWAQHATPHSIASLILIGQWECDHEGDKAIVAELLGQAYELVERDISDLAPDSPLTKVGKRWRFVSHEEAWDLLAPRLTPSDVKTFRKIAVDVFGAVSPKFELPIEERYMASIDGKVLPHSGTLRRGIARTLALMGTHPDRAKNVDDVSYVPRQVMSSALPDDRGWQIWATLDPDLSVLAEASPEALLDAVEGDLASDLSLFEVLFMQEGDAPFGGASHVGLLWALECLAWSRDHFTRVATILARLAEIDSGDLLSNRPAESLRSLFLPWIRFSEASEQQRLATLEMLLGAVPRAGWQLLVRAYPSPHGRIVLRNPPSWQPWAQDGPSQPTAGERSAFIDEIDKLLLKNVEADAGKWSDVVGIIPNLSPETRQRAITLLSQQASAMRQHSDVGILWSKLRGQLHHHRSYPTADWAMDAKDTEALGLVYQELTPSDPVAAHTWVFDAWPDFPDGQLCKSTEASRRLSETRGTAVQAAYESGGTSAVLAIAEAAEVSSQVGDSIALSLDSRLALDLAVTHLGSGVPKLRDMAHGVFRAFFNQSGWAMLEDAIGMAKAGGCGSQALAGIYLAAPALQQTWRRLEDEGQEVRTAYWKSLPRPAAGGWDSREQAFAVQQLLAVHRSAAAVEWLAVSWVSHEVVVQMLEALPADLAMPSDSQPSVKDFHIAELFRKLDQSKSVSDEVIARLEVPYVGMLEHKRPDMALHREVTSEPSLFADLITWAYRRPDGQAEGVVDEQTQQKQAELAYGILSRLHRLPGLQEDSSVDAKSLSAWVEEARRLCKERGREDIGDLKIGEVLANAPPSTDGIWPCEQVSDLLDGLKLPYMGRGFVVGKRNLRGVTQRGVFDGGDQERYLAKDYQEHAARLVPERPFTAMLLREIADSYEREGRRNDDEASWSDQFGL